MVSTDKKPHRLFSYVSVAACLVVVDMTEQRVCADGELLGGIGQVPEASTQV